MIFFKKRESEKKITTSIIAKIAKEYSMRAYFYYDGICEVVDLKKDYYTLGDTLQNQLASGRQDSYTVTYPIKRLRRESSEGEGLFFKRVLQFIEKHSETLSKQMHSNKSLYEKEFNIELPEIPGDLRIINSYSELY